MAMHVRTASPHDKIPHIRSDHTSIHSLALSHLSSFVLSYFAVTPHHCSNKKFGTQIYKMPQSSLAELARNSVLQSGFEMEVKRHWLGQKWYLPGSAGNDINKVRSVIWKLGVLGFFGDLGNNARAF